MLHGLLRRNMSVSLGTWFQLLDTTPWCSYRINHRGTTSTKTKHNEAFKFAKTNFSCYNRIQSLR